VSYIKVKKSHLKINTIPAGHKKTIIIHPPQHFIKTISPAFHRDKIKNKIKPTQIIKIESLPNKN
jgi:hypothetical protein